MGGARRSTARLAAVGDRHGMFGREGAPRPMSLAPRADHGRRQQRLGLAGALSISRKSAAGPDETVAGRRAQPGRPITWSAP
jgi:hypothetical protein